MCAVTRHLSEPPPPRLQLVRAASPPTAPKVVNSLKGSHPGIAFRSLIAASVGIAVAALTFWYLHYLQPHTLGYDFTWPWRAARAVLEGKNPYVVIRASGIFPFDGNFNYPLPAALLAIPFSRLSPDIAAAAFSGLSAALLAFGLSRDDLGRLFILLSPPFLITAWSGQWSSAIMAAALLPAISWLVVCKPTVGTAAFVARPNAIAVAVGTLLVLVSFLLVPTWVQDWLDSVRTNPGHRYMSPVMILRFGGPLLLLALLRWRTFEGRWLIAIAIVPQVLTMYTAFLPMLVAKTRREALVLSALSAIAWVGWSTQLDRHGGLTRQLEPALAGNWIVPLIFLPALVIVLKRPNNGALPPALESLSARLPAWLRGNANYLTLSE